MKGFCSFLNIVACHFNNDQIKSCFFLACALFMYICSVRKSLRSLNVSGPGPLREFLFRNFILVRLSQVDVSVWCIMIIMIVYCNFRELPSLFSGTKQQK